MYSFSSYVQIYVQKYVCRFEWNRKIHRLIKSDEVEVLFWIDPLFSMHTLLQSNQSLPQLFLLSSENVEEKDDDGEEKKDGVSKR